MEISLEAFNGPLQKMFLYAYGEARCSGTWTLAPPVPLVLEVFLGGPSNGYEHETESELANPDSTAEATQ